MIIFHVVHYEDEKRIEESFKVRSRAIERASELMKNTEMPVTFLLQYVDFQK